MTPSEYNIDNCVEQHIRFLWCDVFVRADSSSEAEQQGKQEQSQKSHLLIGTLSVQTDKVPVSVFDDFSSHYFGTTVVMKSLLPPEFGGQKTPPDVDVFLPWEAAHSSTCTLQQVLLRRFSNFMFQVYKRKMTLKDLIANFITPAALINITRVNYRWSLYSSDSNYTSHLDLFWSHACKLWMCLQCTPITYMDLPLHVWQHKGEN